MSAIYGRSWPSGCLTTIEVVPTQVSVLRFLSSQRALWCQDRPATSFRTDIALLPDEFLAVSLTSTGLNRSRRDFLRSTAAEPAGVYLLDVTDLVTGDHWVRELESNQRRALASIALLGSSIDTAYLPAGEILYPAARLALKFCSRAYTGMCRWLLGPRRWSVWCMNSKSFSANQNSRDGRQKTR
jgi:hypothetical protein